jgi:UDP-N-acetylglucosamine 2-epimerase (non-hydrolysing)
MIDAYCMFRERITDAATVTRLGLEHLCYAVVTMHRPVNVDHCSSLASIVEELVELSRVIPVVFPIHPRTRARLESFDLLERLGQARIQLLEPLGYIDFMNLVANCRLVVTDSGGIQEETSYLGIPCLTARESTERPVTISLGSNRLISAANIASESASVLSTSITRMTTSISLWDGHASDRIVDDLVSKWKHR